MPRVSNVAGRHSRFPTSLGEVRVQGGETQRSAAGALGVPRAYVALWETGVCLPARAELHRLKQHYRGQEIYPAWVEELIERLDADGGP